MLKTNIRKIVKWLFITAASLLTLAVVVYFVAGIMFLHDPTCDIWEEGMTKEEKIVAVMEYINGSDVIPVKAVLPPGKTSSVARIIQIPYPNIATILLKNPDCCGLVTPGDDGYKELPIKEYVGPEGAVVLRYKVTPNREKLLGRKYDEYYAYVNWNFGKCVNPEPSYWGWTTFVNIGTYWLNSTLGELP